MDWTRNCCLEAAVCFKKSDGNSGLWGQVLTLVCLVHTDQRLQKGTERIATPSWVCCIWEKDLGLTGRQEAETPQSEKRPTFLWSAVATTGRAYLTVLAVFTPWVRIFQWLPITFSLSPMALHLALCAALCLSCSAPSVTSNSTYTFTLAWCVCSPEMTAPCHPPRSLSCPTLHAVIHGSLLIPCFIFFLVPYLHLRP